MSHPVGHVSVRKICREKEGMSSKRRHHTLAAGLLASLMAPAAAWAQTAAEQTLLDQGQYWQERGDLERAGEAWQKLLRITPQNAQALYGMALVELSSQRLEGAQRYLAQLQKAHPRSPLVGRLQESIRTGGNAPRIETARQQARSGQASQALSTYQAVLGDRAPTGPLALEYYQTLGATAGGWDEARRGLTRLAQESPEDPQIALALAQHLTYRESTRREGIAQLTRLAGRPDIGTAATESWRKALAWTGNRSADIPLYQDFLRANPADTAVQTRLIQAQNLLKQSQAPSRPADPLRQRTTAGFQSLDEGELDAAEAAFTTVLESRPNDGDALGGLGILRLRQERFAEARGLLERASRAGAAGRWKQALDSATYWSLVEQATAERDRGDSAAAQRLLEQAIRLNPTEVTAESDLADLLVASGQYDAAEAAYRRVLARQADNPDAVRGLVGVLAQNNKAAEALALVEKLSPSQQEKVGALGRLRAAQALGLARAATERGDTDAARSALEDALLNDPASPWVRLDLARIYLRMGAAAQARGVMDGLLLSNPNMPEALYAGALLASEAGDWPNALSLLDRIPEKHRTRDIAALQKRVWVNVKTAAASALAAEGRQAEALATLAQAETFATQDPELLGAMALAYADAGQPQRALELVRQVLSRTPRPDVGLRLQYAATLLKTQQDVELAGILRQLQNAPMNDRERKSFSDIRRAYVIRQADGLREAGDLVTAYDTLAPLLVEQPEDPRALEALARMYAANNDFAQAQALYSRLLEKSPNDVPLILQTAAMATGAKDYGYAESLLSVALARSPRSPDVLTAAGRLYRVQGKNSKATEFFTAAVAAENAQRDAVLAASGVATGPARMGNPFAPRDGTAPQRFAGGLSVPGPSTAARMPVAYTPQQYAPQANARSSTSAGLYIPDPAGVTRMGGVPQSFLPQAPPPTPASYYPEAASPAATATPVRNANRSVAPPSPVQRRGTLQPTAGQPVRSNTAAASAPAYAPPVSSVPVPAVPMAATGYLTPAQAYNSNPATQYVPPQRITPGASLSAASWSDVSAPPLAPQPNPARPRTARDELREVQQSQISSFSVGATARARQGEAGMSQLSEIEAPVQLKMSVGDGHLILGVTPTGASAGSPGSPYGTISRFGGGPVTALDLPERGAGSQSDSGIGISVGYESGGLKADIGSTPLGFGQSDVTGGVKYRRVVNDDLSFAVDLSRRPVTDSLLSFAGATDARTGDRWGGVSATGGRVDLTWDDGELGVYGYGALHALTGTRVRSNARAEVGGGMYWHVHRTSNADLTAGLSFTGLSYQRNLRYFTVGHGGYFSPQQFVSFGVPVEWAQREGRLSYQLKGSIGVQYFKEDAAPYFPNSPSRQASAVQAASDALAFGEVGATGIYPGQSRTGLGYNLGAAMEYQMHPQVFLGGHLALNNARNYREFVGGMYVRYAFQPYNGLQTFPVNPLKSPYGN